MGRVAESFSCKYNIDFVYKGLHVGLLLAVYQGIVYWTISKCMSGPGG